MANTIISEIPFRPYNLNPLMRNVLITTAEVIFHAPTGHEVDPRNVQQSIINAEERFLRDALGFDYYTRMAITKNMTVDSSNIEQLQTYMAGSGIVLRVGQVVNSYLFLGAEDQKLWLDILWKLAAECVVTMAYPTNWAQFSSQGVIHNNPTASPINGGQLTSPDLKSIKFLMDKAISDRIDPLLLSLQRYICASKLSYPLYKNCPSEEVLDNAVGRKTDWITGLYDTPEKPCDWDIMYREALVADQGGFIFTDQGILPEQNTTT